MGDKMQIVKLDPLANQRAEVIKMCEELLEDARSGKIVDIAYAGATLSGETVTAFSKTENAHMRLSAVSRLLHRLQISWDQVE